MAVNASVNVLGGDLLFALKILDKQMGKGQVFLDLQRHRSYLKPSAKRRAKSIRARKRVASAMAKAERYVERKYGR